jgi:hypothetical protein
MTEVSRGGTEPSKNVPSVLIVAPEAGTLVRMAYDIPFRALPGNELNWRFILEARLRPSDLIPVDLLVLGRCYQAATLSLARLARRLGVKVLYELDDDLLAPPRDEPWGRHYEQSGLSQTIRSFLDESDLVKAGSPELARRLEKRGYPSIYQDYGVQPQPLPPGKPVPPYRIGYFGTKHHRSDINGIVPALRKVRQELAGEVEFEFIGCPPDAPDQLAPVRVRPAIPDYEVFLKTLSEAGWTLGLAPLRPHPFNEAKSDSKFRDLSSAGILGIYADLPPYRDAVRPGSNGWLCGTGTGAWHRTIREALSLSASRRSEMIEAAREQLLARNHPDLAARRWIELINTILKR